MEIGTASQAGTLWSDIDIESLGTKSYEASYYDLEIGYVFVVSQHISPNSNEPVSEQEWTGVAGVNWSNNGWLIEELVLEETGA